MEKTGYKNRLSVREIIFNSCGIYGDMDNFKPIMAKLIGCKIRLLRNHHKISGAKLAKIIGISQQQMSRYENGFGDISLSKITLISIYFNVDLMFFFDKNLVCEILENRKIGQE